ncbi:hypothetical protein SAMN05446037_102934 [Anaerovirgula multivorans]|uniref:Uncharacterized protein n=1 Tax=Anaerovirgula multivorans TaxID=312168 RepID=A0A239IQP5_9FIRM|nr:hypothetical protein [Anaerovirgula multivorans]SNS95383.1 hypothetical protein SAMN05446037_102934 [Anaerovirgula multivorans]
MAIVSILAVLTFSAILCIIEIPKMLKGRLYRELWTFSVLLGLGTVLALLRSLDVEIPTPADFMAWVYSPVADVMKKLLK